VKAKRLSLPLCPLVLSTRSTAQFARLTFTYTMVLNTVKIQDIGKGEKSVADDLEAVLKKI
jgi:hypothetical protein